MPFYTVIVVYVSEPLVEDSHKRLVPLNTSIVVFRLDCLVLWFLYICDCLLQAVQIHTCLNMLCTQPIIYKSYEYSPEALMSFPTTSGEVTILLVSSPKVSN